MLMQRTFVGVDSFSVFQEVYLQTDDPRVSNIVKFSDTIGELKVEVCHMTWPLFYLYNLFRVIKLIYFIFQEFLFVLCY